MPLTRPRRGAARTGKLPARRLEPRVSAECSAAAKQRHRAAGCSAGDTAGATRPRVCAWPKRRCGRADNIAAWRPELSKFEPDHRWIAARVLSGARHHPRSAARSTPDNKPPAPPRAGHSGDRWKQADRARERSRLRCVCQTWLNHIDPAKPLSMRIRSVSAPALNREKSTAGKKEGQKTLDLIKPIL